MIEKTTPLYIPGPVGPLESLILPANPPVKPLVAVVCHPHPLHGGTMHNKIVHTLVKMFQGVGVTALRFNFRGVGASTGTYAEGVGEQDDLVAVLQYVQQTFLGHGIWLAGFSFGAFVSFLVALRWPGLAGLLSIAPPVGRFPLDELERPGCPWWVVQGEQDEIVAAEAVFAWANRFVPPPILVRCPDTGHFFHGRLLELRDKLLALLPL